MNQPTAISEQWLKLLGKGMVTLPKKWRDEMGLQAGDIVRAKKEGNKVVIETPKSQNAPYRIFSSAEINAFLKEDRLPKTFAQKVRKDLTSSPSA